MKVSLRILNLEDNQDDAQLNKEMLSACWSLDAFHRVETRDEFINALVAQPLDLILSDYSMPGFGGQTALALAREYRPKTPFLFVSGTIGEDTAIESLKNGATDYVLKHRLMRLIPAAARALREAEDRAERDRAEMSMRESEHKYRQVFECLGDAVFLSDENSGRIIDTNHRTEKLLGYPRSDIVGRRRCDFLPALDHRCASVGEALMSPMVHADGSTQPVQVNSTRLRVYDHPLVLSLCQAVVKQHCSLQLRSR